MSLGAGGSRKSRGWAAFDQEQRMKNKLDVDDPFPPLHSAANSNNFSPWSSKSDIANVQLLAAVGGGQSSNTLPVPPTRAKNQTSTRIESKSESESEHSSALMFMGLKSVPIEPEWEDDGDGDVYLTHRKEALRTMRSASRHSKAASNAFLRGDHVSAHQHALEARHQYSHAQTLHAKAAADILTHRNAQNDLWNLDLHGLHAAEALHFLRQHLHRIETHFFSTMDTKVKPPLSSSFQQHASLRPTSVQVITGVGNHSRGQASLPTAVRGFLNENGYHFEELKPGVITIRPKFRISR